MFCSEAKLLCASAAALLQQQRQGQVVLGGLIKGFDLGTKAGWRCLAAASHPPELSQPHPKIVRTDAPNKRHDLFGSRDLPLPP